MRDNSHIRFRILHRYFTSLLNSVGGVGNVGDVGSKNFCVGQKKMAWVKIFAWLAWLARVHVILAWVKILAWVAWVHKIYLRSVPFHYTVFSNSTYSFLRFVSLFSLCSFHIEIYVALKLHADLNLA